ncbi:MAG: hypothetical protein IJ806_10530 [Ruminococcus sp.]|nr:hypothetical protein [Ruminococcus sp.]
MDIIKEQLICTGTDRSLVRAELCVDSAAELPGKNDISGRTLAAGSLAWDISAGRFYGMKSDGTWVDQTAGSSVSAQSTSLNAPAGFDGVIDLASLGEVEPDVEGNPQGS